MAYNQEYGAGTSVFFPGGISGWHMVSQTPNQSMTIDNISRGTTGNYLPASRHVGGQQSQYTEEWEPDGDSSTAPSVTIGDISDDTCVESASLTCSNNARPKLSLSGHVHEQNATSSAKHIGDMYECTFEFPSNAYGAVNPFPSAASVSGVENYEITSSTQTFTITHTDEPGSNGEFLVGVSRGVQIVCHFDATTANTVTIGTGSSGWKITSISSPRTNESVAKISVDGSKYEATTESSASSASTD